MILKENLHINAAIAATATATAAATLKVQELAEAACTSSFQHSCIVFFVKHLQILTFSCLYQVLVRSFGRFGTGPGASHEDAKEDLIPAEPSPLENAVDCAFASGPKESFSGIKKVRIAGAEVECSIGQATAKDETGKYC